MSDVVTLARSTFQATSCRRCNRGLVRNRQTLFVRIRFSVENKPVTINPAAISRKEAAPRWPVTKTATSSLLSPSRHTTHHVTSRTVYATNSELMIKLCVSDRLVSVHGGGPVSQFARPRPGGGGRRTAAGGGRKTAVMGGRRQRWTEDGGRKEADAGRRNSLDCYVSVSRQGHRDTGHPVSCARLGPVSRDLQSFVHGAGCRVMTRQTG